MIGIKLQGDTEYLDTNPDTEIEIQLENPLLGDAERLSPGSFSLPFTLPGGEASPRNADKLKHPDVIANVEAYQVQKADLFVNDMPYKNGTIRAKSSTAKNTIETNFFFGLNSISEDFKNAKLRDVLNDLIVIDATSRLREVYVKYTGAGTPSITVNGKQYSAATMLALAGLVNTDSEDSLDSGLYVPKCAYVTTGTTPNGFAQPFIKFWLSRYYTYYDELLMMTFYLWEDSIDPLQELIITVADEDLGDYIFDSWDLDPYYDAFDTFLSGYLTGTYPTDKFRFPTMFNANLHDGELLKTSEIINAVNATGLVRNSQADKGENSIQPFLMLKWVLDKIATAFDFTLEGDFYTSALVAELLIDNSVTLDVPQVYLYNRKFCWWRRSFNCNELVPDITVVDFLKRICGRYNVGMYYNEQTGKVRMQLREPIALAYSYEDIDSLCTPIESNEDLRITGYTMRVPKEDTDALSVEESVTIGTAQETYELGCGRLHATSGQISGGFSTGPRVSRKNNDKFGLRVFHYLGIADNGVNDYPQADIHGSTYYEAINDFVLLQGIHSVYHKYWLLFEKNRLVIKLKVDWPLRTLMQFDWELKRRFDGSHFLVKSFKVKITNRMMSVGDVELLTMK
jgi:hypothetical protein